MYGTRILQQYYCRNNTLAISKYNYIDTAHTLMTASHYVFTLVYFWGIVLVEQHLS